MNLFTAQKRLELGPQLPTHFFLFTSNRYDQPPNKKSLSVLWYRGSCQGDITPPVWGMRSGVFSVPGIYVETYVYDDVYVRLLMASYVRISAHSVR